MPTIEVEGLHFDERNEGKLTAHGVSIREAYQVLEGAPRALRNHSEGAPWVIIGPTANGRMITLPIDPTDEPGIWRPRTASDSSRKESRRYAKE